MSELTEVFNWRQAGEKERFLREACCKLIYRYDLGNGQMQLEYEQPPISEDI